MNAPLLVIPLALEWVILVTTVAPLAFPGRFDQRPQLGIAIWFGTFLSAGIAVLLALVIAAWGYIDTFQTLRVHKIGDDAWMLALAISFTPWLALAIGGVSVALINQKLEPLFDRANQIKPLMNLGKTPLMNFMGAQISTVDLPFAYALATNREILISTYAKLHLSANELEAVLWHELHHLKQKHFAIKRLARLIKELSPRLAASWVMVSEIERLMEIAADRFALNHTDRVTLNYARSIFS